VGSELDAPVRKSLEQHRDRYSSALLAQHALIVEGVSEEGLLPVFLNALANEPGKNPFHLGLSIVNGESNSESIKHSRFLKSYGLITHILLDYDGSTGVIDDAKKNADFVTSWPNNPPLAFADGYDIEIMLVANVKLENLFEAINKCYGDAGHPMDDNDWKNAKEKNIKTHLKNNLPAKFPPDLNNWDINSLSHDDLKRGFLLAALHGPHNCKNTKDMRTIAEYLAENGKIPQIIERLRQRIVECMVNPQGVEMFSYLK
jgi:predicted ATP-dependent endonuclease of OLD family